MDNDSNDDRNISNAVDGPGVPVAFTPTVYELEILATHYEEEIHAPEFVDLWAGEPTDFDSPETAHARMRQELIKMTLGPEKFEAAVAATRAKLKEDFNAPAAGST